MSAHFMKLVMTAILFANVTYALPSDPINHYGVIKGKKTNVTTKDGEPIYTRK